MLKNTRYIVFLLIVFAGLLWLRSEYSIFQNSSKTITINQPTLFIPDSIHVPTPSENQIWKKDFSVRYGDTFHDILVSLKLPRTKIKTINRQVYNLIKPTDFQVGQRYEVVFDKSFNPIELIYVVNPIRPLHINFKTEHVYFVEKSTDIQVKLLKATIKSSLAYTVKLAGAPDDLADKILSMLAWEIDFKNLKRGDRFEILYEEASVDGEIFGSERILALHFVHQDNSYFGYGFDIGNGWEYFDENGHNLNHAPLKFERITSLYAQRRFHPVRRHWRAHYGMDFEAEEGTPIEAISDGVVTRARYGRANGNNVKIEHSKDLTTQYLHLSKIDSSIHVGDSVARGQIIGLVGSTGLSSGPHLCLRVWYKGRQHDPLSFDFPRRTDVPQEQMEDYMLQIDNLNKRLSE